MFLLEVTNEDAYSAAGIAQYYALFLPVRVGLRGFDYFRETLNAFLCSYYTNPKKNMPLRQAQNEFFSNVYATSIPYMRGFVYLLLVDGLIRQATEGSIGLDEIVLEMTHRQRKGERVQSQHWLEALYPLLGKVQAVEDFSRMMAGETIDLGRIASSISINGQQLRLLPVEQEVMEVGIDPSSLEKGVVLGLIAGSRAERAGL